MYRDKTFLAIIPARGGSKRLPRKNILNLHGKPLIAWSIEAGLKSQYIDAVVVTSDDDEILDISKKFGAETIKRPDELAGDTATTFDAIKHTIDNLEKYDYIVLLQPTSPLRDEKHINEAIELLESKNADAAVSVCEMNHSPLWSNTLPEDGNMKGFLRDEVLNKRSQDLEKYYRLNGGIYICKTDKLLEEESFFLQDNIFAYKMDRKSSIDIDTHGDFIYAELLQDNFLKTELQIAKEILNSYTRQGFGRLLKSEVDLIMFDFSLKMIFGKYKPEYFIGSELNYFAIDKQDIYSLSKKLKISETKIISYIEQIGLLRGLLDDAIALDNFKNLLKRQIQKEENIKKGLLSVQITNKLLKSFVEAKIVSMGIQAQYDNNKEIILFDLIVLTNIFGFKPSDIVSWAEKQNSKFNDKEIQEIKYKLTKKKLTTQEITVDISKTILGKFIGKSSDVIMDEVIKVITGND